MIYVLAQLGAKAGYDIWIGTRERGELYEGQKLSELSLKDISPRGISSEKLERIKTIDVLWLENNKIVAAFEVENTTTITEAVVRVINIPYHEKIHKVIVIPEERENLLAQKIQEPGLQQLGINSWRFIFYDELSVFYEKSKRSSKIEITDILKLNHPVRYRQSMPKALDLFPISELG